MPDTGAPWNIPYVENADLVRDWPADSLLVANAVAAGLSAAGNAGIGSNVVSTLKDSTFSTSSTSYVTVTGLSATITPTSNTSKILILANVAVSNSSTSYGMSRLSIFRGSTDLLDGAGSRGSGFSQTREADTGADRFLLNQGFHILDSPAVGTATTYEVRIANSEAAVVAYVNRSGGADTNGTQWIRGTSTITVIEVAA